MNNHFDGRPFGQWHTGAAGDLLPLLYLAKKARGGDADAAELLTAFGVVITDAKGERYWPMKEGEIAPPSDEPADDRRARDARGTRKSSRAPR